MDCSPRSQRAIVVEVKPSNSASRTCVSPEGMLYRIDLRLRPEGKAGPLTRSLAGYENYYAQWGQTWERMMLIKARSVAGDRRLAAEFVELIQPFRYPRSINESVLREVGTMKDRIENEGRLGAVAQVRSAQHVEPWEGVGRPAVAIQARENSVLLVAGERESGDPLRGVEHFARNPAGVLRDRGQRARHERQAGRREARDESPPVQRQSLFIQSCPQLSRRNRFSFR